MLIELIEIYFVIKFVLKSISFFLWNRFINCLCSEQKLITGHQKTVVFKPKEEKTRLFEAMGGYNIANSVIQAGTP